MCTYYDGQVLHFVNDVHIIKDNLFPIPPLFRIIREESNTDWEVRGGKWELAGLPNSILHLTSASCCVEDVDIAYLFRQIVTRNLACCSQEMYKVFNMGHRMEIYLSEEHAQKIIDISHSFGVDAQIVGRVEATEGSAHLTIESEYGVFKYNK